MNYVLEDIKIFNVCQEQVGYFAAQNRSRPIVSPYIKGYFWKAKLEVEMIYSQPSFTDNVYI